MSLLSDDMCLLPCKAAAKEETQLEVEVTEEEGVEVEAEAEALTLRYLRFLLKRARERH